MPYFTLDEPAKDEKPSPVAIVSGGYYDKDLLWASESSGPAKPVRLPPDSQFQILPSPKKDKREIYYVAGASGSGKSYQARGLAERYKKLFPDREIYLISKLTEDETLDTMKTGKPKRIRVESLMTDPIKDISIFANSMVIFDDYDTFPAPMDKIVLQLIDDIATMGRHHTITMCCLSHYLTNYKRTRLLLNEATHFIVYPQATSAHALKQLLGNHLGMEPDEVKKLRSMGRWVCLHKQFPQWLVSENYAKMLNQDDDEGSSLIAKGPLDGHRGRGKREKNPIH